MWKMKSPEMSCLFCVMLLIQSVHAETLDVSKLVQANHRLLIAIIALVSILLLLLILLCCRFFSVKCSKDPKRGFPPGGSKISTSGGVEEGKILPSEDTKILIPEDTDKKEECEEELRGTSETVEKKIETLEKKFERLEKENELFHAQSHKVDVTLDADTAHPRLQVSEDGKSVTDTGVIRKVPSKEERFDSHTFLLAKEGYTSGMHYWEVDVGKKHNWNLGVAQENVARKETVTLSPKNGFWVIGLADGQEYWAYSDPWTRLTVSGRPQKIGIFLDISSKKLSFISVHQKKVLYTFTSVGHHGQNVRLFPFFSTGSSATSSDTEPLRIARGFDDDGK